MFPTLKWDDFLDIWKVTPCFVHQNAQRLFCIALWLNASDFICLTDSKMIFLIFEGYTPVRHFYIKREGSRESGRHFNEGVKEVRLCLSIKQFHQWMSVIRCSSRKLIYLWVTSNLLWLSFHLNDRGFEVKVYCNIKSPKSPNLDTVRHVSS